MFVFWCMRLVRMSHKCDCVSSLCAVCGRAVVFVHVVLGVSCALCVNVTSGAFDDVCPVLCEPCTLCLRGVWLCGCAQRDIA